MPATAAFWTISNDARPLTCRIVPSAGTWPARYRSPTTLSTALWRPTSSRTASAVPDASNSPAAWRPPVRSNTACASRSRSGSEIRTRARPRARRATASHRTLDVLERRLAAHAARGGRVEVPPEPFGVERPRERDRDHVVALVLAGQVVAVGHPLHVAGRDQALGEQEADGELEVAPRRPHRHRHLQRVLSRSLYADLERFLGGQAVGAFGPHALVHRNDARPRGAVSDRFGDGHRSSIRPRAPRVHLSALGRGAQCETAAAAISETSSRFQNRSSANGAISSGTVPVWIRSAIVTPTIGVALNP